MVALGKTSNPALLAAREEHVRAQQLGKLFEDHAEFVWRSLRRLGMAHADIEATLPPHVRVLYDGMRMTVG